MNRRMWRILTLFAVLLAFARPAYGQGGGIRVLDQSVESAFRDHITFAISLNSRDPVERVRLLYQVKTVGMAVTSRGEAEFEAGTDVTATFTIDQEKDYFAPGTVLEYWWKIETASGEELVTERQKLTFLDERHDWVSLANDRLALFWYVGDEEFGKRLFERSNETLDQIESDAGVRLEMPISIFIYGSHSDLMDAIDVSAEDWTGGMAFTERGVIVLGAAPRDLDFAEIALPHELTHLVIHQATDNPFGDLPTWLDEGLAVYMSGELDTGWRRYRDTVKNAAEKGTLISLQTLSSTFPSDSDAASQSYAQSGVMVEYIIQQYGPEGMARLLGIFSEGNTYDDALTLALGVDTWGLDNAWRRSVGAPTVSLAKESPAGQATDTSSGHTMDEPLTTATQKGDEPGETSQVCFPCLGSAGVLLVLLVLFWMRPGGGAG